VCCSVSQCAALCCSVTCLIKTGGLAVCWMCVRVCCGGLEGGAVW